MIKSPIQKVTDALQSRAIGIVCGVYKPLDPNALNKGSITDLNGCVLDTVVLGKALPLIKKYIDLEKKYFWIVYPRNKNVDDLHLQIAGIWDPYNLNDDFEDNSKEPEELLNSISLKDNFFSIRGQLIFVKVSEKEVVLRITSSKQNNHLKEKSFKIVIKGEIPMDCINKFVSLNIIRIGNNLLMDSFEVIESNNK